MRTGNDWKTRELMRRAIRAGYFFALDDSAREVERMNTLDKEAQFLIGNIIRELDKELAECASLIQLPVVVGGKQ